MSKKDFKHRVLEQQIFDELKDTSLRGSKYLKSKYEGSDIDFTRLYRRLVNYQIKEYGCTLTTDTYIIRKTYEECLRQAKQKRQRRYSRRNYERKN